MGNLTGVYRGSVVSTADPLNLSRIQVMVPDVLGATPSGWATPVINALTGSLPAVGDGVWVTFERGDINKPLWLGAWNSAKLPTRSYVHRGAWKAGTAYKVDDLVSASGDLWRVDTAHTSSGQHLDETKVTRMVGGSVPQVGSLKIIGHSYFDVGPITEGGTGRNMTAGRLTSALGLSSGRVQNMAVSGSKARWDCLPLMLNKCTPGAKSAPRTSDMGVGVIWWGTNDAIMGYGSGWVEYSYKEGMRAAINRFRAGAVYEDSHSSVAYTGSWTQVNLADLGADVGSGTSFRVSHTTNDKVTITTPNDLGRFLPGVWVTLGFIGADHGAAAEVWLDGVKHGDVNNGRGAAFGTAFGHSQGNGTSFCTPVCYRMWIPTTYADSVNSTTTQHTIEIKHKGDVGGSGMGLIFDYWSVDADEPPMVLALSMVQPPRASWIWSAINDPVVHDTYNRWIREIVAEYNDPSVRYVDVDYYFRGYTSVWKAAAGRDAPASNQRWFSIDGLHPNAEGAKVLAEACIKEINQGLLEGASPRALLGCWQGEQDPIVQAPKVFTGQGVPFRTYDPFDGPAALGLSGWTEGSGAWGLDAYNQAYLAESGVRPYRFRDTFTRADGGLGKVEFDANSASPPSWTVRSGTWAISGNKAIVSSVAGGGANNVATVDLGSTTQGVEYEVTGWGTPVSFTHGGVVLRYSDQNNYLFLTIANFVGLPFASLVKRVGGVETQVWTNNDWTHWDYTRLRAEVGSDDVVRIWAGDGSKVDATTYTITDNVLKASNSSATHVGLFGKPTVPSTFGWKKFVAATSTALVSARSAAANLAVVDTFLSDGVVGGVIGGDQGVTGRASTGQGFAFRYVDPLNFNFVAFNETFSNWTIFRVVAGTATSLGTFVADSNAGDEIAAKYTGGTIVLYRNGTALKEYNTGLYYVTDGAPLAGTKVGLYASFTYNDLWSGRWRDFRWGNYMPSTAAAKGDMAVDNTTLQGRVKLYGPYTAAAGWGNGVTIADSTVVGLKAPGSSPYMLQWTDMGAMVIMNFAGANSIVIPNETNGPNIPPGSWCDVGQAGAGQITFVGDTGVTVVIKNNSGQNHTASRYSVVRLLKIAADQWWMYGDVG